MSKLALLFPGQGSQYVGMGKDLYDNFEVAKKVYDNANEILNFDIKKICFDGDKDELTKTENTQPALLTTSIAILEVLKEKGLTYEYCAGHSLGEYSAYVASGKLSFEDALLLVKNRGRLMSTADPDGIGSMAAVIGLDDDKIISYVEKVVSDGVLVCANFNCPGQVVISGEKKAIDKFAELVEADEIDNKRKTKIIKLNVSGAFHSPLMQKAAEEFKKIMDKTKLNPSDIHIISNVTGDLAPADEKEIKESLIKQLYSSVLWSKSIKKLIDEGIDTFIEVGPSKVLQGLMRKIDRKQKIFGVEDTQSLEKVLSEIDK